MKSWRLYYFVMHGQKVLRVECAGEWTFPVHDLQYVLSVAKSSFKRGFILEMLRVSPSNAYKQLGHAIHFGGDE